MKPIDVAVVGGGPGGCAVATLLARSGHQVSLFEAQEFPRFHIGESLIPAVNLTLEKLGLLEHMARIGFVRKHGVQFFSTRGPSRPFYFSESADPRLHSTWQVDRASFDQLLLEHAEGEGVDVHTRARVTDVIHDGSAVSGIHIRRHDGQEATFSTRVLVDATGQDGLLAQRLGGRTYLPGMENAAVFAHYRNVRLDPGIDGGSTLVFRVDSSSWFWFIPLRGVVSIGLVAPAKTISTMGRLHESLLDAAIDRSPHLKERMLHAERATEVRVLRDWSYRSTTDGGRGWLLVGDALGFIDPIYSTGLLLTMLSAERAAVAIDRGLRDGGNPSLEGYSADYTQAFDRFLTLVRAYYTEGFHFGPLARDREARQGLVDLLIGDVDTPAARGVTRAIHDLMPAC